MSQHSIHGWGRRHRCFRLPSRQRTARTSPAGHHRRLGSTSRRRSVRERLERTKHPTRPRGPTRPCGLRAFRTPLLRQRLSRNDFGKDLTCLRPWWTGPGQGSAVDGETTAHPSGRTPPARSASLCGSRYRGRPTRVLEDSKEWRDDRSGRTKSQASRFCLSNTSQRPADSLGWDGKKLGRDLISNSRRDLELFAPHRPRRPRRSGRRPERTPRRHSEPTDRSP